MFYISLQIGQVLYILTSVNNSQGLKLLSLRWPISQICHKPSKSNILKICKPNNQKSGQNKTFLIKIPD